MQFYPQRLPWPQNWPISGTSASQHFLFFDNRRKIKSRKTRFVGRPPLSRLRRRFAPLRGTQRRCAALRAAPPGRYAPRALRVQPFCKHEKNACFSPSQVQRWTSLDYGPVVLCGTASTPHFLSEVSCNSRKVVFSLWESTVASRPTDGRTPMSRAHTAREKPFYTHTITKRGNSKVTRL